MSQEQKITNDIKVINKDLENLKKHFPQHFDKNGNFDFEKFKNYLSEKEVNFSTESYGLEWLGKSYARFLASDPATTLLRADETHNNKPENINSENLLIKGDNLEVLKHLANAYYEKVKMIYIDPPYNTGSDGFVYEDDRKFTVRELENLIGIDEERAKRILDFTQSKSNSHSAWLTFIYPRLYIAKQLLKDDGVIFVSIDDNEVAQLRLLMDEVFGEENFVDCLNWKRKKQPSFLATHTAKVIEYILVYAKNFKYLEKLSIDGTSDSTKKVINLTNEYSERIFSKGVTVKLGSDGIIEKGKYLIKSMTVEYLDDVHYKNGKTMNEVRVNAQFSVSQKKIDDYISDNLLFITANKGLRRDVSKDEIGKRKSITDLLLDWGDNQDSDIELQKLFHGNYFEYAKPSKLIYNLAKSNYTNNSIILDFFAGSGTTGDAVMQLNAEDGGNRKFILVQLPEAIDPKKSKTAYDFVKNELNAEPTIFEITKERLLRAAKKINAELDEKIKKLKNELPTEENKAEIEKLDSIKTQNCFKIFETTPIWEDYDFEAEEFDSSQTLFDAGKLSEEDVKALLTTWKTYDGIALTQELEPIVLSGEPLVNKTKNSTLNAKNYIAYYGNSKLYLMHKGFTTNNLQSLLEKVDTDKDFNPTSIICFGYHFESKNLRELAENVKSYSNKKNIDIDFITRY